MPGSVSVIIPAFNAGRWLAEAIESSLRQTYPLEILVVDDGSTDETPTIANSYKERVQLISQSNHGGCAARNVGLSASSGDYVQFLDADDLILPKKIERQVAKMEDTGADVVYGDWRHQFHEANGSVELGPIELSGPHNDVLLKLLSGWWVPPVALLFRRSIVLKVGGWDEALRAAQDRDFFTRVAMASPRILHVPFCDAIYRRYGPVTVSTENPMRYVDSHLAVSRKIESMLEEEGRLSSSYRAALAKNLFGLARVLAEHDLAQAADIVSHVERLAPGDPPRVNWLYQLAYRIFGFKGAERLAAAKRKVAGRNLPRGLTHSEPPSR